MLGSCPVLPLKIGVLTLILSEMLQPVLNSFTISFILSWCLVACSSKQADSSVSISLFTLLYISAFSSICWLFFFSASSSLLSWDSCFSRASSLDISVKSTSLSLLSLPLLFRGGLVMSIHHLYPLSVLQQVDQKGCLSIDRGE